MSETKRTYFLLFEPKLTQTTRLLWEPSIPRRHSRAGVRNNYSRGPRHGYMVILQSKGSCNTLNRLHLLPTAKFAVFPRFFHHLNCIIRPDRQNTRWRAGLPVQVRAHFLNKALGACIRFVGPKLSAKINRRISIINNAQILFLHPERRHNIYRLGPNFQINCSRVNQILDVKC